MTIEDGYGPDLTSLVNSCLIKDEYKRPDLEDILETPWLNEFKDIESNKAYMRTFLGAFVLPEKEEEEMGATTSSEESSIIEDTIEHWKNDDDMMNVMSFIECH